MDMDDDRRMLDIAQYQSMQERNRQKEAQGRLINNQRDNLEEFNRRKHVYI